MRKAGRVVCITSGGSLAKLSKNMNIFDGFSIVFCFATFFSTNNGIMSFIEIKIKSANIKQAKKIANRIKKENHFLMVGFISRFDPSLSLVKEIIRSGKIGKIVHLYARRVGPFWPERVGDIGVIKDVDASRYALVGPPARGSGIKIDARASDKYDAYDEIPFNVIVRKEGDSWARMMVRWDEALESVSMSRYVLEHLPRDSNAVPDERRLPRRFPPGETFTRAEAPRGELTYYVLSDGKPKPYRVKIRTPSFNNIINGGFAYIGYTIADLPAILVSYDPCISCMERAIVIDLRNNKKMYVSLKDLVVGGRK